MSGSNGNGRNGNGKPPGPCRLPLFETDPQVRETIMAAVRNGRPYIKACQAAGITAQTFSRWKKTQGAAYDAFREELKRAQEEGIQKAVERVLDAGEEDWRATAWWLARCFPEEFSEKRILEHRDRTGKAGKRRDAVKDDELRSHLDRAASRLGAIREPGGAG